MQGRLIRLVLPQLLSVFSNRLAEHLRRRRENRFHDQAQACEIALVEVKRTSWLMTVLGVVMGVVAGFGLAELLRDRS